MEFFLKARPVWAAGREREMNLTCGFCARIVRTGEKMVTLTMTGSCFYHVYINGEPFQFGPARCAHGYYRVDEWDIAPLLREGENFVALEVSGYNINSFYSLDQPSFVQAEIRCEGEVLACTDGEGRGGFTGFVLHDRVQRVQRYSFQRAFAEAYRLRSRYAEWRMGGSHEEQAPLVVTAPKTCIARELPPFVMKPLYPGHEIAGGVVQTGVEPDAYWRHRSLTNIGVKLKGYREEDLELCQSRELQEMVFHRLPEGEDTEDASNGEPYVPGVWQSIDDRRYRIYRWPREQTGFLCFSVRCEHPVRLFAVYDEILTHSGAIDPLRQESVASIRLVLEPGSYKFQSADPIGFRYLMVFALDGGCEITDIHLREFAFSMPITAVYETSDKQLRMIYDAAVETFRQNAADLFTDCPTRERGGWLCDSYFTSRVEYALTGQSRVERLFLQNYLLPDAFDCLPKGMLPMCYPGDHYDGWYIPNWALWFVVELKEYVHRSGDRQLAVQAKRRVYELFEYFKSFENEYGLLEKLDGWIFVEWSKANDLVQDVNYPTNMLFAAAMSAAGRLFGDEALQKKAEKAREAIRRLSFDGEFFADNACRAEGGLRPSGERTEACQYYAFFFDTATPDSHPALWNRLLAEFGPHRTELRLYPEIYPANALGGICMRLYLLSRYGHREKVRREIADYCAYMVEKTGTLWEHVTDFASCNHGYASYVAELLLENA